MKAGELDALLSLVDSLRARGVRRYKAGDIELELGPLEAPPPPDAKPGETPPDACKCGHAEYAHVNGLCVHGCDVEKCAPEETTK